MKKNICILFIAWLLQINCAYTQSQIIDSLNHLLYSAKQDSTRSLLLEKLSEEYMFLKNDTALHLASEGIALAKQSNFVKGEVESLRQMGFLYSAMGNDVEALKVSLEALKMAESINDQRDIIRTLLVLGVIYSAQKDYGRALHYRLLARDQAVINGDQSLLMLDYLDLGADYEHLNQFDSAIFYSEQAFAIGTKLEDKYIIGSSLESLGDIYLKMKRDNLAIVNYRKSIPFCIEVNDYEDYCGSTIGLAIIFKKQGIRDSSLYFAKLAYSKAKQGDLVRSQFESCSFLANYYKDFYMLDSAFAYLQEAVVAKDSLYNLEKIRKMQALTMGESIRQQELATQMKEAEDMRIRNLQLLGIGVSIPILFIGVLLLSRTKVRPRVVEFLGILSLLLFFEFITDLIFPYVSQWTNENAILEMLFLVIIAALLEPVNFKLEHWVKEHVAKKHNAAQIP